MAKIEEAIKQGILGHTLGCSRHRLIHVMKSGGERLFHGTNVRFFYASAPCRLKSGGNVPPATVLELSEMKWGSQKFDG